MRKRVLICAAAFLAVGAVAAGLMLGLGGGGYEKVIKDYFQAIEKGDGKKIFDLSVYSLLDSGELAGLQERIDKISNDIMNYQFGKEIKTTCSIIETKRYSLSEYFQFEDDFEEMFAATGLNEFVMVEASYSIRGSIDSDSGTYTFMLFRSKNRWYLMKAPYYISIF